MTFLLQHAVFITTRCYLTSDLEALHTKINGVFIIFTHLTGADLAEIFGFYKL